MSASQPCPVLVINLRSSQDRWAKVSAELTRGGLVFERHEAVDGRRMSAEELKACAPWNPSAYFKPLSPGEVGCFLSHISVAERIVREGWERALVLEDDILLGDDFLARLRDLLAFSGKDFGLIKIEGALPGGKVAAVTAGGQRLMQHRRPPSRTAAQLWSQAGARQFLATCRPFHRPVDVHLKHWWEHGVEIAHVSPALVFDGDAAGSASTIGARSARGLAGFLRQTRYRWAFAFSSHWHFLRRHGFRAWCGLFGG